MRQVGASWLACLLQQLSRQHNTDVFDTLKRSLLQNLFILQLISECFKLNWYIQCLYSSELYIKYKELRDDSGQGSNQPLRGNHDVRHIASDFSTCNRNTLILLSAPEKSSIWLFGLTLTDCNVPHLFSFIYLFTSKDKIKSLWQLNETTLNLNKEARTPVISRMYVPQAIVKCAFLLCQAKNNHINLFCHVG